MGLAKAELIEGENIIIAIRAKPAWNLAAAAQGAMTAASSNATGPSGSTGNIGSKKDQEEASAAKSGFPYPGSMAIVLTNKRLLIWERSKLWGYVKSYTGDFKISDIESVKMVNSKGMGDRFLLKLKDQNAIRVYGKRKDGTKLFKEELAKTLKQ